MAVAVAVAVSGGVAVPVAVPVAVHVPIAGLTKRFLNLNQYLGLCYVMLVDQIQELGLAISSYNM